MKTISLNLNSLPNSIEVGTQYDNRETQLFFSGLDGNLDYVLRVELGEVIYEIPINSGSWIITNAFTQEATTFMIQVIASAEDYQRGYSRIRCKVRPSLADPTQDEIDYPDEYISWIKKLVQDSITLETLEEPIAQYMEEHPTNAVQYTTQTLTDPQKTQARSNISAAGTSDLNSLASSFSGALSSATGALSQAIATNFNNSVHITAQSLTENQKNQVKDNLFISKNIIDGSAEKSLRQLSAYPETAGVYSLGSYAIALGSGTKASGASSIAEGWSTLASGENSHAEGSWSESTGSATHAEGYRTKASSSYAHAEGTNTLAAVAAGHAEGNNTIAYGTLASHAEGSNTMASGMYAHAEGSGITYSIKLNGEAGATTYTLTTPVEIYPWSMGSSTFGYVTANNAITKARITAITKSGNNITSITVNETLNAEAAITNTSFIWIMPQARGAQSHTEGLGSVALGSSQHVGGQYNIPDSTSLEIIGNGTSNLIRSNARTLDKDGNEVLSGKLTVGAQAVNNMDVPTLSQVRNLLNTTIINMTASDTTPTLSSDAFYIFPEMATLTVTVASNGLFQFRFTSGATPTALTVNGIVMPDNFNVEANKVYEVNIFEGYGTVTSWSVTV